MSAELILRLPDAGELFAPPHSACPNARCLPIRRNGRASGQQTARRGKQGRAMAARSIASITISFGLVAIPVKLYSATQASGAISFNLLHKTCGSRLRQQYFCIKEDVPVGRDEMVRGYEF